jgi:hypothetical protein
MNNNVEYTLSLKDMLTPSLKNAELEATKLETKMTNMGEKTKGMFSSLKSGLGMIGVGFAAFKGLELIHEGVEAVHKLHAAEAQVKAGLESTGHAAGLSYENLEEMAKGFSSKFKYSRAEITDMQSVLLTFPSVTKDTFESASEAIFNMSTRMGSDVKSTTVQIGKALQDPIHGISALKRVGVNFSESQKEVIQSLVDTGQTAKAQALILNELKTEFGGSAEAAAKADPLFAYNKAMGSMKMAMGEVAITLQKVLAPALMYIGQGVKTVATGIKSALSWLKENSDVVKAFAITVGILTAAIGVYWAVTNTAAIYTGILTAAQWLLNVALSANPIGVIVVAIGVFVAGIVYAWENCVKFRAVVLGLWGVLKEFGNIIIDVYSGVWKVIKGVFTMDGSMVVEGFKQTAGAMKDAGTRMATAYKEGYDNVMAEDSKKKKEGATKPALGIKPATANAAGVEGATKEAKSTSPKGASGSKSVTINITIGKLIESFKVQTNNIGEGTGKVREMVAETLLSAINDSQVVAGI